MNFIEKIWYWLESGFFVDIDNLGKITKNVAIPEKISTTEVRPGLFLKKSNMSFSKDNVTNIYDLHFDPKKSPFVLDIFSSEDSYYLADTIQNDNIIVATVNGGFFYISDVPGPQPNDKRYNLCIQDSKLCGLPVTDDPILYIRNGEFFATKTKARGICQIGEQKISWLGAKSNVKKESTDVAILYNSRCFSINGVRDSKTNLIVGIPDERTKATPKNDSKIDLVVSKNNADDLVITAINPGGGTHLYDGLFIFQTDKLQVKKIKVNDSVKPMTVDTIDLANITSGMTIGRSVDDPCFYEPKRINRRDARAVIAKDKDGIMHFFVFDGSKYIPGFNGISAKDITPFFYPAYEWAFFLDGGASARIIVRQTNGLLRHLANRFAYRKLQDGQILWNWKRARKIYSSIALRITD